MRIRFTAREKWAGLGTRRVAWMVAFVIAVLGLAVDVYGLRRVIYGQVSGTQARGQSGCSDGWYITGYFVPREDEFPGEPQQIEVERVGTLSFSNDFLEHTRTEGWGITRFGWALGYYGGGWHRSDSGALDASGKPLSDGVIAIDRSLIPSGAQVQISTLPTPWGSETFRASDVGVGIEGQHIDVFTGTGSAAEQETFRITSENNRVCVTSGR
jgi:3D (Asp-Asp-Asp) domain-containing protein